MNENPDYLNIEKGKTLTINDMPQFAFGYYDGQMRIGYPTHFAIHIFYDGMEKVSRYSGNYTGRAWLKHKVISFWYYPPKNKMKKVIKDIEKEYAKNYGKIKIWDDPEWRIEVIAHGDDIQVIGRSDERYTFTTAWTKMYDKKAPDFVSAIIPLKDYVKVGSEKRTKKDVSTPHLMSPMVKGGKIIVAGWGSKKYAKVAGDEPVAQWRARQSTSENHFVGDENLLKTCL